MGLDLLTALCPGDVEWEWKWMDTYPEMPETVRFWGESTTESWEVIPG